MPRYIDADKMVSKDNAYTTFPHDLAGCDDNDLVRWINEQPTADVVPKSEVERLQCQVNRLKKYDEERDIALHKRLIANAKAEVAREIFEEIEKKSCVISETNHSTGSTRVVCYQISAETVAKLKKKHTEGAQAKK